MTAKIFNFPIDIGEYNLNESEHVWTDEEIIRAYEENFEYEKDEYYYNWLMRQEQEQKNIACFVHKLFTKFISIFH